MPKPLPTLNTPPDSVSCHTRKLTSQHVNKRATRGLHGCDASALLVLVEECSAVYLNPGQVGDEIGGEVVKPRCVVPLCG